MVEPKEEKVTRNGPYGYAIMVRSPVVCGMHILCHFGRDDRSQEVEMYHPPIDFVGGADNDQ